MQSEGCSNRNQIDQILQDTEEQQWVTALKDCFAKKESIQQFKQFESIKTILDKMKLEENNNTKKTSYKNYRILYMSQRESLQKTILMHIKNNKQVNLNNEYGIRIWQQQDSFVPIQFVNCQFINTSLLVVNDDHLQQYIVLMCDFGMKYLSLSKLKDIKELKAQANLNEYLKEYDIVVVTTSKYKHLIPLLDQQINLQQTTQEKEAYQNYLQLTQLNAQQDKDIQQVNYLLNQQINGQLLKERDFTHSHYNITGKIFQRVILDATTYCNITHEIIGKMQWYLTNDHVFNIYATFNKRIWKLFYQQNEPITLRNAFINGIQYDIANLDQNAIRFRPIMYCNDSMRQSPANRQTNISITENDLSIIQQIDLLTFTNQQFPTSVYQQITSTFQLIDQQNMFLMTPQIRNNVTQNINNIEEKFNTKTDECCSICFEKKDTQVYFMCCFNQMCLQCFAYIVNKNKPILQCIVCKLIFQTVITKKLIFIKTNIKIPIVKTKHTILNELDAKFGRKLQEINNKTKLTNEQLSIADNTFYLDIHDTQITQRDLSLNETTPQLYLKIFDYLQQIRDNNIKIKEPTTIYILGHNKLQLQNVSNHLISNQLNVDNIINIQ